MKRIIILALTILLFSTSYSSAKYVFFSPDEMLDYSQYVLIGEVKELRQDPHREFVLAVETVYKGNIGMARIAIPLPEHDSSIIAPPSVGTRLLVFLKANEFGRLAPVADFNWAAYVNENQVSELYLGAALKDYGEAEFIGVFNRFLSENTGTDVPVPTTVEGEDEEIENPAKDELADESVDRSITSIFMMAGGVLLILLVISAKIKGKTTIY